MRSCRMRLRRRSAAASTGETEERKRGQSRIRMWLLGCATVFRRVRNVAFESAMVECEGRGRWTIKPALQ